MSAEPTDEPEFELSRTVADLLARRQSAESLRWIDRRTLWNTRNDIISRVINDQVDEERSHWVAAQRDKGVLEACPDFTMEYHPDRFSFFVMGDTGDGTAKQYALVEPLRQADLPATDFALIMSDVIYPAGDVNEYVDNFYMPYQGYHRPIYGLPGNHDWYDGLNGFMFNFCAADPPPIGRYRPSSESRRARIGRILWRRASRPERQKLIALRDQRDTWFSPGVQELRRQPGPYFAIKTGSVTLVMIDTGINGTIDREQADWLLRVSRRAGPKILFTGKPLWVDGRHKPCAINPLAWHTGATPVDAVRGIPQSAGETFETVDSIVTHPAFEYVAAIGGDVHNYQRYERIVGSRTLQYLVSGGGGAYMSATHRFLNDEMEQRPEAIFPSEAESIEFYSRAARYRFPRLVIASLELAVAGALLGIFVLPQSRLPGWSLLVVPVLIAPALAGIPGRVVHESLRSALAALTVAVLLALGYHQGWTAPSVAMMIAAAAPGFSVVSQLVRYLPRESRTGKRRKLRGAVGAAGRYAFVVAVVGGPAFALIHWTGWPDRWILLAAILVAPLAISILLPYLTGSSWLAAANSLAVILAGAVALRDVRDGYAVLGIGTVLWLSIGAFAMRAATRSVIGRRPFLSALAWTLGGLAGVALIAFWPGHEPRAAAALIAMLVSSAMLIYLTHLGVLRIALARQLYTTTINAAAAEVWKAERPRVTVRDRTFDLLARLPREPEGGPLSSLYSEFFDFDLEPPFYKSFIRVDITKETAVITPYQANGFDQELKKIEEPIVVAFER